jgi:hypothetical protein
MPRAVFPSSNHLPANIERMKEKYSDSDPRRPHFDVDRSSETSSLGPRSCCVRPCLGVGFCPGWDRSLIVEAVCAMRTLNKEGKEGPDSGEWFEAVEADSPLPVQIAVVIVSKV